MLIEKLLPSGDLYISDLVKGQLFKRRYSGYSKKQAVKAFKAERELFKQDLIKQ